MKIKKYLGHLSSGVTIDHSTPAGTVLHWPGLHWSSTEDRLEINRAEIQQTALGEEVHISIRIGLMPFTETMSFVESNPVEIFLTAKTDSPILIYAERPVHCFMEGQEVPVEPLNPDGFFQVMLPVKKESCQLLFAKP